MSRFLCIPALRCGCCHNDFAPALDSRGICLRCERLKAEAAGVRREKQKAHHDAMLDRLCDAADALEMQV